MLQTISTRSEKLFSLSRGLQCSVWHQSFKQKERTTVLPPKPVYKYRSEEAQIPPTILNDPLKNKHVQRNAVGVQLLSRSLHAQIFKNCSFPPPAAEFTNISKMHLEAHGLKPADSSTLPSTEFTLPPLQGHNLLEHFHRIGSSCSEPYISLAKSLSTCELPPRPENWDIQSGWTKYYHRDDGSSYSEHVPYPIHDGKLEQLLSFDVETMPKYHQYAVLACAASPNAWYAWISPWLLDPSSNTPEHLVPLGDKDIPRVIVGHNVSYDRSKILEEYHLNGTRNRFIDTMALHVAIKGISSHQRPAWMKWRKNQEEVKEKKMEAYEAVISLMHDVQDVLEQGCSEDKRAEMEVLLKDLEDTLPELQASLTSSMMEDVANTQSDTLNEDPAESASQTRWEDITSANSLVDVAKLHCSIDISKEIRSDFMTCTPEEILASITDYLSYCASDVHVTHCVYQKVLPGFLKACPHPVSFAGIMTMGSGFLPVNEQWEAYLERAEGTYQKLEQQVRMGLADLARSAMEAYKDKEVDDVWLSQLNWSPKAVGKSRGLFPDAAGPTTAMEKVSAPEPLTGTVEPAWYAKLLADPFSTLSMERIVPLLLQLSFQGYPMKYTTKEKWHFVPSSGQITRLETAGSTRTSTLLSKKHVLRYLRSDARELGTSDIDLCTRLSAGERDGDVKKRLLALANDTRDRGLECLQDRKVIDDPWLEQLDWSDVEIDPIDAKPISKTRTPKSTKPDPVYWPKWYWELMKPKKDLPPGTLDITIRNRVAPLLLKLSWYDYPLFHSAEHGWIFRVPSTPDQDMASSSTLKMLDRLTPLTFYDTADEKLANAVLQGGYKFYKLPHKDGEKANVGSPLGKTFMKFALDGVLRSGAGDQAKVVVDVGVQCSYWVSARDRILNQMVQWESGKNEWDMGFPPVEGVTTDSERPKKWGIILPLMITMGTVTRRAIEKTWLTASNAKKNRVGSELKSMVRAPPGYAIIGADVDSEELWISSCMGDAQFGFHGASAIGWMTLEGTKAAGTDLHSKTASILGISRDQAKVFNYSRIYGAGMRHAVLLLLQGNPGMAPEEAQKLAENLYASTKGKNTHRTDMFERKFWFGGSESFLFNKLEEIAMSDLPQTPALGCGVTNALSKEFLPAGFGSDYMPSRINWVVQSSGVDYLHLLIVSMDHLISKYDIKARYLISVHDELRYLVAEEDKYRGALALQIANIWTRSMFAYKLGLDDLPEGIAFFSAVDIDKVLRKEVDMPCITPSQPIPIPPGESLNIAQILAKTNQGSLEKDGSPMTVNRIGFEGSLEGFIESDCLKHRASSKAFLQAQATNEFAEVKHLAQSVHGIKFTDNDRPKRKYKPRTALGSGEGFDWSETVERLLKSGRNLEVC